MKTVFVKLVFIVLLAFSLIAVSCNTNQRRDDVRVREGNDGKEDVRVKQRMDNDSVSVNRERTIRQNEEGDRKLREDVDVERDKD